MRASPLRFALGNLVWGGGAGDVWALYRLAMRSYGGLSVPEKVGLLADIAGMACALERECQLLRVGRAFSYEDYLAGVRAGLDPRHGHPEALEDHLIHHRRALGRTGLERPECYLAVRLDQPRPLPERLRGARARRGAGLGARARELLGLADPAGIRRGELAELRRAEREVRARVCGHLEAEPAGTEELTWLVLRAYARGVAEPERPFGWRPQALVIEDEAGEELLEPLEHDVLRLFETPLELTRRGVVATGEGADSHQALLVLGALAEEASFPGAGAELLFAPLEAVGFPVDACLWLTHVPNARALALVRRRILDADNIWREEASADHGPSAGAEGRPEDARALEAYLSDPGRPPLFRATISLAVGAPSAGELEERVEALRAAYRPVALHRPLGEQLALWRGHLPCQPVPVRGYEDVLLAEQVGALVPVATHAVGTSVGPYLGYTLSGSAQPVLWDLTEASASARPPATLIVGRPGSGKTILLETLVHQAYLLGSAVVDTDPKGDHRLAELIPERDLDQVELSGDPRYGGLLDPLVIAPPATREDAAVDWLADVLPPGLAPQWRIAIRRAVAAEAAGPAPTCRGVIARLAGGERDERTLAEALSAYADSGLSRLGFADRDGGPERRLRAQVTALRIRALQLAPPGTARADLGEAERIGEAVLRLVALYAMHLMSADRARHKLIALDEAFLLLASAAGERLVEQLSRWARSENATPILVTHLVPDAERLDNLIGARFVMGMENDQEAAAALALLHLDRQDPRLRRRLLGFAAGRCYLRDLEGRVGDLQVHLVDPAQLEALDTTPGRPRPGVAAPAAAE